MTFNALAKDMVYSSDVGLPDSVLWTKTGISSPDSPFPCRDFNIVQRPAATPKSESSGPA